MRQENGERGSRSRINMRFKDKTYNEAFRKWRKQSRDTAGFYIDTERSELTYKEGYGFVEEYPETTEENALRRVFNIVGMTVIFIVGIDLFYQYILIYLLNYLGFDIRIDIFTGNIYGSGMLMNVCYLFFEAFKRAVPFWYCYKRLNMPLKLMVPLKIAEESRPLHKAAVPAALLASGVCAALSFVVAEMCRKVHIIPANWAYAPADKLSLAVSIIGHAVIVPVISEIYMRGPVTQILRQFGDGFAIIITALLTMMITYDINHFCFVFLTSAVIGYFSIRTGSVITGVIMRITTRFTACGVFMIDRFTEGKTKIVMMSAFLLAITLFGLIYMIHFMLTRIGGLGMSLRPRYLSLTEKLMLTLTSIPMTIGMTLVIVVILIHTNFVF